MSSPQRLVLIVPTAAHFWQWVSEQEDVRMVYRSQLVADVGGREVMGLVASHDRFFERLCGMTNWDYQLYGPVRKKAEHMEELRMMQKMYGSRP